MAVELGVGVGEDGDGLVVEVGCDDALDEGLHDFAGGVGVDLGVEGDDGAEDGAVVAVAGLDVDVLEGVAGGGDGGAAGVDVLHAGAGGAVEELDDVEGVGYVLEVGLGESGLSVLEDDHVADDGVAVGGLVEGGGLVWVGAVAEVVDLGVVVSEEGGGVGEGADVLGEVGLAVEFVVCHGGWFLFGWLV